jgi:hypothetical protein
MMNWKGVQLIWIVSASVIEMRHGYNVISHMIHHEDHLLEEGDQ